MYHLSINYILLGILAALFVRIARVLLHGYNNVLASVPGPWHSRWTGLAAEYHWVMGDRPRYVHSLHQKYGMPTFPCLRYLSFLTDHSYTPTGPIVRVGPDEVDICDVDTVHDMHKAGSGFLKSAWYDTLTANGAKHIFSVRDPKAHSVRRRLLASPLSDASLQSMHPTIAAKVELAVRQMHHELQTRGFMDVFKWWYFMSTDLIGELSFGHSFQLLERGEKTQMAQDLESLPRLGMIGTAFPSLLRLARLLPLPYFRAAMSAARRIGHYATQSIHRYQTLTTDPTNPPPATLFTKLFHTDPAALSDIRIASEAQGYIVGGSDNTAITLTYLVWAVCRDEAVRAALLRELDTLPDGFGDEELRELPFLECLVKETLRLYATNPSSRPRNPPAPGSRLCGFWIPGAVTVSTQAFSLHRDKGVFPEPERFNPWRWTAATKSMNRAFIPFGGGSRICLGLHLAVREIRLGAAHFFRTFPGAKVSSREGMSDADMEQVCYFIMSPAGKRCLLEAGDG
ncbi:cytochrome P450 [Aspergillus steynii IBT 23096]|uniref:Cytochrome P450 n=1 Tax=Aspergillus steynii IBT 23096 TaxID=1392250 RepID=A0A2I2G114_9EURO|nr:cytochrome P450 [Aspergillus steynii IBT 23096]PLB46575.1 cytochrome P450 [Aspergillus steynii IBT 23096]